MVPAWQLPAVSSGEATTELTKTTIKVAFIDQTYVEFVSSWLVFQFQRVSESITMRNA